MHHELIERYTYTVLVEHDFEPLVHFAPDRENIVLIALRRKLQGDARRAELRNAVVGDRAQNAVDLDIGQILFDDALRTLQRLTVFHVDKRFGGGRLDRLIEHAANVAVVYDLDISERFELGRAYTYGNDRAAKPVDSHYVADVEFVFEHDEQPRHDVRNKALHAQADDERQHARTRYERRGIYAPHRKHGYHGYDGDDAFYHIVYQARDRYLPLIFSQRAVDDVQRDRRYHENDRHDADGLNYLRHEREQSVDELGTGNAPVEHAVRRKNKIVQNERNERCDRHDDERDELCRAHAFDLVLYVFGLMFKIVLHANSFCADISAPRAHSE